MKLRNIFLILVSFLCCLPTINVRAITQSNTTTTVMLTTTGILAGALLSSLVAERTKSPAVTTPEQPTMQTLWQRVRFTTGKHLNLIRTALYTLVGAVTGALVGLYAADAIINRKEPTLQDKLSELQEQLEQEQKANTTRFRNMPEKVKTTFSKDEQTLYLAIKKELATPFEDMLLEPSDQEIFKEMADRLKGKILVKYQALEEQLRKTMQTEQPQPTKPTSTETTSSETECPVCFEKPQEPVHKYQCDHALCTRCFDGWKQQPGGNQCPMCRKPLK